MQAIKRAKEKNKGQWEQRMMAGCAGVHYSWWSYYLGKTPLRRWHLRKAWRRKGSKTMAATTGRSKQKGCWRELFPGREQRWTCGGESCILRNWAMWGHILAPSFPGTVNLGLFSRCIMGAWDPGVLPLLARCLSFFTMPLTAPQMQPNKVFHLL